MLDYCSWCKKAVISYIHFKLYHTAAFELGIKNKKNWYKYLKAVGKMPPTYEED